MKKANTITFRLGLIIMGILVFCIVIIFLSMYRTNYEEIRKAAGVEAYGCANITTALIDPNDIEKVKNGDEETARKLGEDISWTIQHKNIFEGQYVLDLDGQLLAVDENLLAQGFEPGDSFHISEENLDQLLLTKAPTFSEVYEFGGMKRLTGYAPVFMDHDPDKEIIAISAIDFESSILHTRTWDMIEGSFLFAIIPILLAGVATIYLIKRTTAPLTSIIQFAGSVAEGDLTVEALKIKSNNEIGQLSKDLNILSSNLKEIVTGLTGSSSQLASFSEELSASGEQVSATAEQNMQSFHQVENTSSEQVGIVNELNKVLSVISDKTTRISEKAMEISAISVDTTAKAENGDHLVQSSVNQMERINTQSDQVSRMMELLTTKSHEINDIITIITKISEQTNLLALNASIEASHAGENGKGFAVVAEEIRKLAEQSYKATGQISNLIEEIQLDTENATKETTESMHVVDEGTEVIREVGRSFIEIRKAINQEAALFADISKGIASIAHDVEGIVGSMKHIEEFSEENAANAKEVFSLSEEQVSSIEEITVLMNNLNDMAEDLNKRTHHFSI